ncbi:UNVERIFIED_CONTAM: hypothetical protein FKN15_077584 [Acipenser sinensis]
MVQANAMQLLLILALLSPVVETTPGKTTEAACTLQASFELPGFLADGDIIIGGLFPMHYRVLVPELNYTYKPAASGCQGFDSRSFRWAQTMRFAIKEINENPSLLPNITLGYKIYDSCATHVAALRATLSVLNGPKEVSSMMCSGASPVKAIIGDSGSSQSTVVSRTLQPFKIPMISYFATCSCLSNRNEYPTFFRLVPSDFYQVKAIAQLVKHFGWTWVGGISEDDEYGRSAFQELHKEFKKIGVCFAYFEVIPKIYSRERNLEILDIMKKSSAKVVISFAGEGELYPLLTEYVQQNITGIQWIASEAWITASLFSPREFYPSLGGTIGFAIRSGEIPGLKDFLLKVHPSLYSDNALVKELWSTMFGCTFQPSNTTDQSVRGLPLCTGHESLEEKYSAYTDVSSPRVPSSVCTESCPPGTRKGVRRGEPLCCFDCLPCAEGEISNQTDSIECIQCPVDFWSNPERTECIPKEIEYLTYDEMGVTLTVIALFGACLTIGVLAVFLHYKSTPIVRVNNSELSFFILLSLALCFLSSIAFIGSHCQGPLRQIGMNELVTIHKVTTAQTEKYDLVENDSFQGIEHSSSEQFKQKLT